VSHPLVADQKAQHFILFANTCDNTRMERKSLLKRISEAVKKLA